MQNNLFQPGTVLHEVIVCPRPCSPRPCAAGCVPQDRQIAWRKPEIAIEAIDRVRVAGVRFGCVLADAGYGSSGLFRQAPSARGLVRALGRALGLSRRQTVCPADVGLVCPEAGRGRRRKYPDTR